VAKYAPLLWPGQGSGAVAVPTLCVVASSPHQPTVPIASLTKMMTTWVVLHALPLTYSERGPCTTVTPYDLSLYDYDVDSGQSHARIVLNEHICEGTLLRGLLVHSAGNYSQLLQEIIGWSPATFVRVMNRDATSLGLLHTHYVDLTGISPGDRSTATDQVILATDIMANEPIVDQIVALTHVALPYNGQVQSYTPLIGDYGVVGVKSGYTTPAGGCDVMALRVTIGATTFNTYAVVLGQNGANALNAAGAAALTLSRSLRTSIRLARTSTGDAIEWIGPPSDVQGTPSG
jgi:D-alanyl-D-alanine carboxypeptidase (penicillin-binding protein 5/6)